MDTIGGEHRGYRVLRSLARYSRGYEVTRVSGWSAIPVPPTMTNIVTDKRYRIEVRTFRSIVSAPRHRDPYSVPPAPPPARTGDALRRQTDSQNNEFFCRDHSL